MATKPTTVPRWAETAGGTPAANITTPSSGEQDTGYTSNQIPTSGKLNWLFRFLYDWILYLKDAVFVATSGSGLAGVDATGDGTTPGVKATPGGAGSPARGALNLVPQADPSAPSNGDVWTTVNGLFARIAGATLQFLSTLQAAPSILVFGYSAGFADTTARFAPVGTGGALNTTEGKVSFIAPSAGKISKLNVNQNVGSTTQGTVYTVRKNGGNTALTVTLSAGGSNVTGGDSTNSFAVANGDVISVQAQGVSGITVGATDVRISMLFTLA